MNWYRCIVKYLGQTWYKRCTLSLCPQSLIQGLQEVLVPTFEIVANPQIRLSDVKARRFYIIDNALIRAREAIQREEDLSIFNAINAAVNAPSPSSTDAIDSSSQSEVLANGIFGHFFTADIHVSSGRKLNRSLYPSLRILRT